MTDLSVFFAGTAGSVPTARRGLPATLVRRGSERLLFDCGEGTQRQLLRSVGLADLDFVFLTHHHVDHWLGLLGMVKSFALRDRERPLTVYGPPGTQRLIGAMGIVIGRLPYPFDVVDLAAGDALDFDGGYCVEAFNVRHRGTAFGYALVESPRPGRFDAARAAALGVPFGPDLGRLQRGEHVDGVDPAEVVGPPRPGRRIVLSGDTTPCDAVRVAADGADLLVHEATFMSDEHERAAETRHSTATQAASLAAEAGVRLLALTHVSTRYAGGELLDEARATFGRTEVPRDFDTIDVPLAEKGEPLLHRWDHVARAPAAGPAPAEAAP
ncbi:MAG: Ribonuclease Z [uncultured Solirubrobacteraceae bacterium]|uniref:Ribonuclease Z n=1 Tax=uncultured Solirubrobacteraceae bacterium TaxID=1162706 RepID=A0A6J4RKB0_9ACTN|nr:MAG: Ribonuclease Z [uncultured Solirubrobacteraceae bacterium]